MSSFSLARNIVVSRVSTPSTARTLPPALNRNAYSPAGSVFPVTMKSKGTFIFTRIVCPKADPDPRTRASAPTKVKSCRFIFFSLLSLLGTASNFRRFDFPTVEQRAIPLFSARPGFLLAARLPYDGLPQSPEMFAGRPAGEFMDVLSEVLKVVKLQGALYYNGEFSAPWSIRAASSHGVAQHFVPDAEHVIIYHLLTEGHASIRLDDGTRVNLNAGDIVMIPHGDPHILENGP